MKKHTPAAAAVIAIVFLTSCGQHVLRGSGDKTTASPAVASFSAVVIDVSLKTVINVQSGSQPAVQLSGYENLLKHIKTTVENNTLRIYTDLGDDWRIESDGASAQITLPAITALTLNGANDADIHGAIHGSVFRAEMAGAGDLAIDNVTTDTFAIDFSGAGTLHVKDGAVKYADYELNGAGTVKATSLQANEAVASINGTGSIAVNAVQKLTASINGAGSISYKGNPTVTQEVNGAGSISRMQ